MGDGEVFGEMAFVDALPPAATVRAESPSIVLAVDRAALARHIDADPGFGCRFYRALAMFLSDRLRAARRPNGDAAAPEGELDGNVLDAVSEAGTRFQRLSQTLLAEGGDAR
jgi:CRP-like cAMP-binding protein